MDWTSLIERLVVEKSMSRAQIAAAIGCSQSTFSDIAVGKTKDPRTSIGLALLRLAHEYGIEVQLPWAAAVPDGAGSGLDGGLPMERRVGALLGDRRQHHRRLEDRVLAESNLPPSTETLVRLDRRQVNRASGGRRTQAGRRATDVLTDGDSPA